MNQNAEQKTNGRTHRLMISLSPVENAALKAASESLGESMAAYTRRCLRCSAAFAQALAEASGKETGV